MAAAPLRRLRLVRRAVIALMLALVASPLSAQNIIDGRRVEFQPSADNDTVIEGVALVDGYSLNIYVAGSSTVVSSANLGKPDLDPDGYIRVAYLPLLTTPLQVGVTYEAKVVANGPGGAMESAVSNTFALTSVCGTSTIEPGSINIGPGAATGTVAVTSTCGWGSISDVSWIAVTTGARATATGRSATPSASIP